MKHVMVDLETLGTVADAVILSIGAVRFDLDSSAIDDMGFYASISIDSNLQAKRRIQEDTLLWWLKQDAAAQEVFHEPKKTLEVALGEFGDWLGNNEAHVWSNGADFDLPMLAHAYTSFGMEVPWKFWNSNCFRTYKKLPGAKTIRSAPTGVKHNALSDAYQQAQTLQMIQHKLFGDGAGKHSMIKAKA
jgi:hypothetical protein